ncbi:hypothetical protein PTKIN_Ptkin15bG0089400 [Pterospermum kingtungense]
MEGTKQRRGFLESDFEEAVMTIPLGGRGLGAESARIKSEKSTLCLDGKHSYHALTNFLISMFNAKHQKLYDEDGYTCYTLTYQDKEGDWLIAGNIPWNVINKERKGNYLEKTIQVVLHIIDATQEWIECATMIPMDGKERPTDICFIELGGTIGTSNLCRL